VFVSAVVGAANEGTVSTHASVAVGIVEDQRGAQQQNESAVSGGQKVQIPIQTVLEVPAGTLKIGLATNVNYSAPGPGDVRLGPVSVTATVLPPAAKSR
jgi:hypothetical protein